MRAVAASNAVVHRDNVSAAFDAGMALAALVSGDGDGAEARLGLAPRLAERLESRCALLLERKRQSRTAALLEAGAEMRAEAAPSNAEPRRVLALLASEVDKKRGAVWLASVPGHRSGWGAPADLRAMLLRRTRHDVGARAEREIAELEASAWPE